MSPSLDSDTDQEDVEYVGGLIKRVSNFQPKQYQDDFQERKRFQKTVYLLQAFDINVGFEFNWYIHGPYCSPLAAVGYSLAEQYDQISEKEFADQYYENQFSKFRDFIGPYKEDTENLEISASLHYLWERNRDKPKDILIEWLLSEKELNSDFRQCETVWGRLVRFGAINEYY